MFHDLANKTRAACRNSRADQIIHICAGLGCDSVEPGESQKPFQKQFPLFQFGLRGFGDGDIRQSPPIQWGIAPTPSTAWREGFLQSSWVSQVRWFQEAAGEDDVQ
jgi:hypothetical protein